MIRLLCWTTPILCAGVIFAAAAQPPTAAPAAPAPSSASSRPRPKPTNLKVLPENTDIRAVMHQYEADLGVNCRFCHAAPDETTHKIDFASDDNPTKGAARFMIQMTADLNTKYLAGMPDRSFGDAITCGTCHRGHYRPPAFAAPPESEGNHPPVAPGAMPPPPATGLSR